MTKDEIRTREDFINLYALHLGLDRFIEAQDKWNTYQTALEEVKAGKKRTHWIWFIFPQMEGLGTSEKSRYYGIRGRDEAIEYINHPILRDRLVEITEAVYNNEKSVYEIFGNDVIKVRSCMLLLHLFLIFLSFKRCLKSIAGDKILI